MNEAVCDTHVNQQHSILPVVHDASCRMHGQSALSHEDAYHLEKRYIGSTALSKQRHILQGCQTGPCHHLAQTTHAHAPPHEKVNKQHCFLIAVTLQRCHSGPCHL